MASAFKELEGIRAKLEKHFKDVRIRVHHSRGKVFMLQTRNGKRTGSPPSASLWT